MKYASVCSGVEAATLAWKPLGWEPVWFSEIEPFPCAVLQYHYPDVPNLGDMTKIKVTNKEDGQLFTSGCGADVFVRGGVDLLVGGTPCFVSGSLVLTPGGYRAIESLNVGDEVVTHTGKVSKIIAVGSKDASVGEVKILGRPPIVCTAEHPFYTIGVGRDVRRGSDTFGQVIAKSNFEFTPIAESVGRYAGRVCAQHYDHSAPAGIYQTTAEDVVELAGWYVGDGYIRRWKGKNKKAVILSLVSKDKLKQFSERFVGIVHFSTGSDGKVTISNTRLAEWLISEFGEHAINKRIPYWLYTSEFKAAFLHGYAATDGGYTHVNHLRFTTVSPSLAYGVADLYETAAICFTKRPPTHVICGRVVNQHDTYVVDKTLSTVNKSKKFGDRYATRILRWNDLGARRVVYNITVEGDHSYIVNGFAVHNCQSFSVSGKREGLKGASGLAKSFVELLGTVHPRWFLWENVPGCLSSRDQESGVYDFNFLLAAFAECGYSLCWRIIDSQFTRVDGFPRAVPQRRRRVFVVGYLGSWEYSAGVLLESGALLGNSPPRRVKGKGFTEAVEGSTSETSCSIGNGQAHGVLSVEVANTLNCMHDPEMVLCYENHGQDSRVKELKDGVCPGLNARAGTGGENLPLVYALAENTIARQPQNGGNGLGAQPELAYTQNCTGVMGVYDAVRVRKIMPIECERLMGFPDNYTRIPWRGKPEEGCPDSHRYKACGNSFAVNAVRWIGKRIQLVEEIIQSGGKMSDRL